MSQENIESIYPLSPMQEGMLFHSVYAPESGIYVTQTIHRLHGELNVRAYRQAWQQVVARHAILRTLFVWQGRHRPLQVVRQRVDIPWVEHDWQELDAVEQQRRLERFIEANRQQGFELSKAPLMRLVLIRLSAHAYQVVWSRHHALLDRWSTALILQEVHTIYRGLCQGQDAELKLPRAYRDYIAWLQQQDAAAAASYWRAVLKGFTAPTSLGVDQGLSHVEAASVTYAKHRVVLSTPTTGALQALARQYRVTLNTLVQGAWAMLLSRYSGECDVVFGATVAGREASLLGVEAIVGLLINTVPVRVTVSPCDDLLPWLKRLQREMVEHVQYGYSGLVDIQGCSEVPRGLPLFHSLVVFENTPVGDGIWDLGAGVEVVSRRSGGGVTNYPLALVVQPGGALLLQLTYDSHRFHTSAMLRMLEHVQRLLEGMASGTKQRLGDLSLFSESETQQLLVAWNDTRVESLRDACIHAWFERQVEKTPDAKAVVCAGESLTYRELNTRANHVAHHLQRLGVGPEVVVGLCVARSLEMVVGLLGILKAGGAYVPLDPSYPRERLAFMVEDTQAPVVLTQQALVDALVRHDVQMVCLDTDRETLEGQGEGNPPSQVTSDNLAYVIYTSGSTGKPKGVAMRHGSLSNLITWQLQNTSQARAAKTLQFASMSFDVSFQEMFSTWCAGGTLVLLPEDVRRDPDELLRFLRDESVERLFLPCVALQQLAEAADSQGVVPAGLHEIVSAGEPLQVTPVVRRFFSRFHDCTLSNHYGPTESHVVTAFRLSGSSEAWPTLPPIGRPIANTQIYLLDSQLQLVPIGARGELYIGGVSIARGYLNRPDQTAERFIPNPFSTEPGARLYKTGDQARYREDGHIEFVGRLDHQVKVRGFRVEPGEIEAVLHQHPQVHKAVVTAVADTPGGIRRLVAYVVPKGEVLPSVAAWRAFVAETLPEHMMPSVFKVVDALPLTPSGKVDRSALPPLSQRRSAQEQATVSADSELEETLARLWAEVLGVEKVSRHDNFFELGGHSLLAMRLISRLSDVMQRDVPMQVLFSHPSIAAFLDALRQPSVTTEDMDNGYAPRPDAVSWEDDAEMSFAQQRLWFLDRFEPGLPWYNITRCIEMQGHLNVAALAQSLNEIVRRHDALRTWFGMKHDKPRQMIHPTLTLDLPTVDLQSLSETAQDHEVQRVASQQAQRPFDLGQAPLVRVTLLRRHAASHVLVLTIHHIVTDGWSMGVLFRELGALYEAFAQGKPSPLAELPMQYAGVARWQRQYLQGEILARHLAYWRQQLEGVSVLQLPTDRPRPAMQTYKGASVSRQLPKRLAESLKALGHAEGATLFMVLLGAFGVLLHRYSGQDDLVLGSPIAGRTRTEMEQLIGFFVNTLVLRLDVSGKPSFRNVLRRVRDTATAAYTHQELPFEKLVEELKPERNLSHSPLFQVLFVLQNMPMQELKLSGLTLSQVGVSSEMAKFDLSLFMTETADGVRATLSYNVDLFDANTIERMIGYFKTLLEGIIRAPDRCISELPLLTESEKHQLVETWNHTHVDYPRDQNVHGVFEARVEQVPAALAVVYGEASLTYRELNQRANQLAHHLRHLGVGPDTLVGLCVERSLEMVIALLAILKAGGAYVPLDPTYPAERLAFMLQDAAVPVVLTQAHLRDTLPASTARVVCLDAAGAAFAHEPASNPQSDTAATNLAYVMYTSGSTGKPKGVLVTHSNITRLFRATAPWFRFDAHDVWTLFHSYAFDFSVWELWGALLHGGRLVVVPYEVSRSPGDFYRLLQAQGVTVLNQTPSAFRQLMLVDEARTDASSDLALRLVIFGGAALDVSRLQGWVARHGETSPQLVNMYGITETTVHVTYCPLRQADAEAGSGAASPIGVAIPDLKLYLLDAHLQPVPIGMPGELYVGGAGVARGYLNRPELTRQRFIPNPFSAAPDERLYKSGDLVRYRADGMLEYLGRIDDQVKIRGFRVEPGEVEAVLGQHPEVRDSAVIARADGSGERCLVAYVVTTPKASAAATDLRTFLQERLPDHMVPAVFVTLETLPLTPNGKVDRQALTASEMGHIAMDVSYVAPRVGLEKTLAEIWAEVLSLEKVGRHDNFFEIGGHSLHAVQLVSKMSGALKRHVSVKSLFAHPTIATLSKALAEDASGPERVANEDAQAVAVCLASESCQVLSAPSASPDLQLARHPLLSLFAIGKLPPVDAAALGVIPNDLLMRTGLRRDEILHGWYDNLPTWRMTQETAWGRIASIILPRFAAEIYDDRQGLLELIVEALELAARLGAKAVSLTGLLPSATDDGQAVTEAMCGRTNLPRITTGYATRSATMMLAMARLLQESGRNLMQERVGFLGLGAVGRPALRLMLQCLPHPHELQLCDVYSRQHELELIRRELVSEYGFQGEIRCVGSRQDIPAAFYTSTLIISAINVPDLIDISRVNPGTMLVDDAGPHGLAVADAVARLESQGDILFTEGDVLQSPQPIQRLTYVPPAMAQVIRSAKMPPPSRAHRFHITGCSFTSLLSVCFAALEPTVGLVDDAVCRQHYEQLRQLGFQGADLHIDDYVVTEEAIRHFRQRFGGQDV